MGHVVDTDVLVSAIATSAMLLEEGSEIWLAFGQGCAAFNTLLLTQLHLHLDYSCMRSGCNTGFIFNGTKESMKVFFRCLPYSRQSFQNSK